MESVSEKFSSLKEGYREEKNNEGEGAEEKCVPTSNLKKKIN